MKGSVQYSTAVLCRATWSGGSASLECHLSSPWGPQSPGPGLYPAHTPPDKEKHTVSQYAHTLHSHSGVTVSGCFRCVCVYISYPLVVVGLFQAIVVVDREGVWDSSILKTQYTPVINNHGVISGICVDNSALEGVCIGTHRQFSIL